MADVRPFVATRFNSKFNKQLADLLTPPYDVIDAPMQQAFYDKHPNNIVRVDFGKVEPGDNEETNRYSRAEASFSEMKKSGVLLEDSQKSFYVYEQEFALPNGQVVRRRGFFAAVKIHDFTEGGVRAHEHTFAGPKADRFNLTRATNSNMSPIFVLFDEPEKKVDALLKSGAKGAGIEAKMDGVTHRLWVVNDQKVIAGIQNALKDKELFIADGHHRYETALRYREEMRKAKGKKGGNEPYDYTLMYLNNIHDDGMVILPTHRVLSRDICDDIDWEESMTDLAEAFEIEELTLDTSDLDAEAIRVTAALEKAGTDRPAFVMIRPQCKTYLLTLKKDADLNELIDDDSHPAVKQLDVTILHSLIINRAVLGNPELELDHDDCHYMKETAATLKMMTGGKHGVAFLMNSTKIEQVCEIALGGMRMPHKSTYFYPKLVTGLVIRDMNSPW